MMLKFKDRECIKCKRYPCFENITKCHSNFAGYGCTMYICK